MCTFTQNILKSATALTAAGIVFTHTAHADQYAITLSPSLAPFTAEELRENINDFVLEGMKPGDSLVVVDGLTMDRVGKVSIPNKGSFKNKKLRRRHVRKDFAPIKAALAKRTEATNGQNLYVSLPVAYEKMGEVFAPLKEGEAAHLLIISSPIENNNLTPGLSFRNGRYPSDGHIKTSKRFSPYGRANLTGFLDGINVHVLSTAPDSEYASAYHKESIHRFNYLSVIEMGGNFVTFTNQPDTAFERMAAGYKTSRYQFDFDTSVRKITMLDVPNPDATPLFVAEPWLSPDAIIETTPPPSVRSTVKIGIRWDCTSCDLDIYARGTDGSQWVYYGNRRTNFGKFFKDWMTSPDASNGLEVVHFTKPVLIEDMQVMVNFYSGATQEPPAGVLRIFMDGKVYEAPFQINTTEGDRGRSRSDPSQSGAWYSFDLNTAFIPEVTPPETQAE